MNVNKLLMTAASVVILLNVAGTARADVNQPTCDERISTILMISKTQQMIAQPYTARIQENAKIGDILALNSSSAVAMAIDDYILADCDHKPLRDAMAKQQAEVLQALRDAMAKTQHP